MTRARVGLTGRLVLAQVLVLVVMTATLALVAWLVGPRVFDEHLREAGHGDQPHVLEHAQEAFRAAGLTSAGAGLLAAALATALVGALLFGRIGRSLTALSAGARRVASGDYDEPVQVADAGPEIDELAGAFNDMAHQIADTETTRRRLLTDLAHELRTPIAAIDVTLESLEDGVVDLNSSTLATLRAQTARLTRLAVDIRDVSAAEEGRLDLHPRSVRVSDLLEDARTAAAPAFVARSVGLVVEPVADDPTVQVDPTRISQVLDNLLRNALQHSPVGSTVTLRATVRGDSVQLRVVDQGTGVAPEHLPHLFERFYRADSARHHDADEGTGVGLAISRSIARAHEGSLEARSDGPGRGTEFTLTLPAS